MMYAIIAIVILICLAACLFFGARIAKNVSADEVAAEETKQRELELECTKSEDCRVGILGRLRKRFRPRRIRGQK